MIRRLLSITGLVMLGGMMTACTTDSDESVAPATDTYNDGFVAKYIPAAALMPFPNDLLFADTTDGTVNMAYIGIDESDLGDPLANLGYLDGFGLNSKIYVDTTDTIDGDTLINAGTVFLINTNTGIPVAATVSTSGFSGGGSTIEIDPVVPLAPATTYIGVVTKDVLSSVGDSLAPDDDFQALVQLFNDGVPAGTDLGDETTTALYGAVQPVLAAIDGTIGADNVAVAWSFKTQSIGGSLAAINAAATAQVSAFIPIPRNGVDYGDGIADTSDLNEQLSGHADVYVGVIELPYYSSSSNPLGGYWTPAVAACDAVVNASPTDALSTRPASTTGFCPTPKSNGKIRVPVLLTVPNASALNGDGINGVTIFQHGITQDRSNLLAVADTLADANQAGIAIDLPLHGITDTTSGLYASDAHPLYAATTLDGITEATFNLDVDEDGTIDDSGEYFINLTSLITSRDNLRQAAANLIHLVKTVPAMDYNAALDSGVSGADFGVLPISFVGHSLGGITGTLFLGSNTDITSAVLAMPGGDIGDLLLESPSIGAQVKAGLADSGVIEGTRLFDEFFRTAQTAVEDGDPVNYGSTAATNSPIHMIEVVGGAGSAPDLVVPNSATEKLATQMGLTIVGATDFSGYTLVQFTAGDHGSILDPTASLAATVEMQRQMATFISTSGGVTLITDGSVIQAP